MPKRKPHYDSLERRRRVYRDRVVGRNPSDKDKSIEITEADLVQFGKHYLHGPLDTLRTYCHVKHLRPNFNTHQKRQTKLYNGVLVKATLKPQHIHYLEWPEQQQASLMMRSQYFVYDNGERALEALDANSRLPDLAPMERTDPMRHRYYNACTISDIEYFAKDHGIDFISRFDILSDSRTPEKTRQSSEPLLLPMKLHPNRKSIIPDDLFGLSYGGPKRFFVHENDLGNEQHKANAKTTTIEDKWIGYIETIETGLFQQQWGIPKALVLTTTDSMTRAKRMMKDVSKATEHRPSLRAYFLFKVLPHLGEPYWKVPPLMPELLSEPWDTLGGPVFINKI